ncbi:MAG: 3-methyl-2-oxobutanoate hydroxymethyltransferase [Rhodospirillales bacterium]|nr:3-methyl-2-oxobutanoate hydroxymethyltransferase [Rhodospirillales bacterium]MCB9995509.1 3-methyl-2-oxobutanoate hydroxymethyltransferase [Rhodospirillales bacterium]
MSHQGTKDRRKTIRDILALKGQTPIVCLTAYSAPMARAADEVCDIVLVGDSLGMVLYGMDSTVPVTLDMMMHHGRAVSRATEKALIVVDLPFGAYQESGAQAFRSAAYLMKETGAQAVKLEGGLEMTETVAFMTARGIPVMGHIGLQPQSVHAAGGYKVVGRSEEERSRIMTEALALQTAGAFAIVMECVDPDLADHVTQKLHIPTIGIGASAGCDGQILVSEDMTGLSGTRAPKFVKPYAALDQQVRDAVTQYAEEVRSRVFPAEEHVYRSSDAQKKIKILK